MRMLLRYAYRVVPVGGAFVALFVAFGIVFVLGGVLPEVAARGRYAGAVRSTGSGLSLTFVGGWF
jgi:hypothetical protein